MGPFHLLISWSYHTANLWIWSLMDKRDLYKRYFMLTTVDQDWGGGAGEGVGSKRYKCITAMGLDMLCL